jgi:hypothetical protein
MRFEMPISSDLFDTILQRAREGKLEWSELSDTGFIAPIGLNSIVIDQGRTRGYTLRITNERGTVIDTANSDIGWGVAGEDRFEELYELARRKALRVDETLVQLKRTLEEL